MKLYYHPLSSYSRKVLIALAEKQLSVETEEVNLFDPEVKAAFKTDVNPFGKVPVLKLENPDWMIPESSIIIEYLDGHYDSGTRLIPEDKDLARQARFHDRIECLGIGEEVLAERLARSEPLGGQQAPQLSRRSRPVGAEHRRAVGHERERHQGR